MREVPIPSMCRHTNGEFPSPEHVQMLYWACADIIMRGYPVTEMTDNTEYTNANRQCLHTTSPECSCPLVAAMTHITL